jgi:hypothetical protein
VIDQRPAARRRMSGADRRTQLLDLTRDVVADEGFAGLTIDRIARAAGVTRTVIYQQFTDLPGLSSVDGPEGGDGTDGTERLGRGILAYLHDSPTSWRIILRPPDGAPPELRGRIEIGRAYARRVAARHLSRAIGTTVDPDGATGRILLASMEELARLHLESPDRYPDDVVLHYLHSLIAWAVGVETATATAD